jgi:hypothetical protein
MRDLFEDLQQPASAPAIEEPKDLFSSAPASTTASSPVPSTSSDWSFTELLTKGIEAAGDVGTQVVTKPKETLEAIGDFGTSMVESAPKVIGASLQGNAIGTAQLPLDIAAGTNSIEASIYDRLGFKRTAENLRKSKANLLGASDAIETGIKSVSPDSINSLTPGERTAANIGTMATGGAIGAEVALAKLAKGAPKFATGLLGGLTGEAATTGGSSALEPMALGSEDTDSRIKARLLNPLENLGMGLGVAGAVAAAKAASPIVKSKVQSLLGKSVEDTAEATGVNPDTIAEGLSRMQGEALAGTKIELKPTRATPKDLLATTTEEPAKDLLNFGEGFGERLATQPEISAGGAEEVAKILGDSSKVTSFVNKYGKLFSLDRARAKASGIDIGSFDSLEKSEVANATNRASSTNAEIQGLLGDPASDVSIVRDAEGKLVESKELVPLRRIYQKVLDAGASPVEVQEFMQAKNAMDDYVNNQVKAADLKQQIREATLGDDLKLAKKLEAELATTDKYTSVMPLEDAQAAIAKYSSDPVFQTALEESNAISRHLLDKLYKGGIISSQQLEYISRAHPNYVPNFKVVNDVSGQGNKWKIPGLSRGIKGRKGSGLETMSPLEAQVRNITLQVKAAEKSSVNNMMLQHLLKSPADELAEIFVEPKEDILAAKTTLYNSGNTKFNIDGGQLELTFKNPQFSDVFNNVSATDEGNFVKRLLERSANFMRYSIVNLDPTFNVRSIEREAMDFKGNSKKGGFIAPILRGQKPDYVPLASQVKNLFLPELNPELNSILRENYGHSRFKDLTHNNTDDLVAKVSQGVTGEQSKGLASRAAKALTAPVRATGRALEEFSTRADVAVRALGYQMYMKNGGTHDEAMRIFFEMGFNPAQRGSNKSLSTVTRIIPFSTAFINSTDKLLRTARYEPKKLATGFLFGAYLPYKAVDLQNQLWKNPETDKPWQDTADPNIGRYTMRIYGPWSKSVNDYVPFSYGWVIGRAAVPFDKTMKYAYDHIEQGLQATASSLLDSPEAPEELKDSGLTAKDIVHGWFNYVTDIASLPTSIPVVSPLLDVAKNEDRLGRAVVPEHIAQDKEELKYLEYDTETSQALKDYSRAMESLGFHVSPKVTQYLWEHMTYGAGKAALSLADKAYAAIGTPNPVEKPKDSNFPGSSVLVGDRNQRPGTGNATAYKGIKDSVVNTYRGLEKLQAKVEAREIPKEDLRQYMEDNRMELKFYPMVKETQDQITELYKQLDSVKSTSRKQTPERELLGDPDKREAITRITSRIDKLQGRLLAKVKETEGAEDLYFKRNKDVTPLEQGIYDLGKVGRRAAEYFTRKDEPKVKEENN